MTVEGLRRLHDRLPGAFDLLVGARCDITHALLLSPVKDPLWSGLAEAWEAVDDAVEAVDDLYLTLCDLLPDLEDPGCWS